MSAQFVVIYDPTGTIPVGDIVEGDKITAAKRRNVVLIPADDRMFYAGTPGFYYRPWGSGFGFDGMQATRGCNMMLAITPFVNHVYWAALLLPIRSGEPMHGLLRCVSNSSGGLMSSGLTQKVLMPSLQGCQVGPKGGVVVVGKNECYATQDGILGMSLYGTARNVRVMWSAAACSDLDVELQPAVPV